MHNIISHITLSSQKNQLFTRPLLYPPHKRILLLPILPVLLLQLSRRTITYIRYVYLPLVLYHLYVLPRRERQHHQGYHQGNYQISCQVKEYALGSEVTALAENYVLMTTNLKL